MSEQLLEGIVAFTWRRWLRERAILLRYTLWREVFLLPQCSGSK